MKHRLLAFLLALTATSFAQTIDRRPGEILVQMQPGVSIQTLTRAGTDRNALSLRLLQAIAPRWQMYLIGFDETDTDPQTVLGRVRQWPGVRAAQFNHRTEERDIEPNDPMWSQQNDMTLIEAPAAWGYTTGGLTPAGDTIVVAVLEKGALLTHPDLLPNRWYNWAEIPGNDLDDDGNGYIDDFAGWNPRDSSDNATGENTHHGTAVHGIIGAAGNNGVGVTGVNWTVKMMSIGNTEYESEIISAYQYVDNMRRIYNETDGLKGAFVVTTNASFGLDLAMAADHPLWCAVYDSLGKHGIVSVGATTNLDVNVDIQGDMPTSCPSEYLITVNNIDEQGIKRDKTGYGLISIDLGAPGEATHTTGKADNGAPTYGSLGGTSAATPHVTGSVALLYSLDCELFTSDALTDPPACARRVRDVILNHTEPNTSLAGITTTGGHLNLANAVDGVNDICDGVGVLDVLSVKSHSTGDLLEIYYQTPILKEYRFRVFNMLGQLMYEKTIQPVPFNVNKVEFDGRHLPSGVYVVSIGRGKTVVSRKFPKF